MPRKSRPESARPLEDANGVDWAEPPLVRPQKAPLHPEPLPQSPLFEESGGARSHVSLFGHSASDRAAGDITLNYRIVAGWEIGGGGKAHRSTS